MQNHWSEPAKPGHKVKVKMKDEPSDGIIDKSYFITKFSFNKVLLADTSSTRELQFRELKFCH